MSLHIYNIYQLYLNQVGSGQKETFCKYNTILFNKYMHHIAN